MKSAHAVAPVVAGVTLTSTSLVIRVGGLGPKGLVATIGANAFEVLGECHPQPAPGTCISDTCLCWMSIPIASATKSNITLRGLPVSPRAVRFLWYISPYAVDGQLAPFQAPVYALSDPIPNAVAIPGGANTLPLGPFVFPLP